MKIFYIKLVSISISFITTSFVSKSFNSISIFFNSSSCLITVIFPVTLLNCSKHLLSLGLTLISGTDKVMFSVKFTSSNPPVGVGSRVIGVGKHSMD